MRPDRNPTIPEANFTLADPWNNEGEPDARDMAIVASRFDTDDDAHDAPLLAMLEMMPA